MSRPFRALLNRFVALFLFVWIMVSLSRAEVNGSKAQPCTFPRDANGSLTAEDKQTILIPPFAVQAHSEWISTGGRCGSQINQAALAELRGYRRDDLRQVFFSGMNLEGKSFFDSDLRMADFGTAEVMEKDEHGHLGVIRNTNLANADFRKAKMDGAALNYANLDGAYFEPASLPDIDSMATAMNLDKIRYVSNPSSMLSLRKKLEEAGYAEQAQKVTYALRMRKQEIALNRCLARREDFPTTYSKPLDGELAEFGRKNESHSRAGACLSYVADYSAFYLTSHYGLSPFRPGIIILVLATVAAFIYFSLMHGNGSSALYVRIADPRSTDEARRFDRLSSRGIGSGFSKRLGHEVTLLHMAFVFSFLSAFNLGFHDIDIGRWVRMVSQHDYNFQPTGWARTISGIQSLITLGMVVLTILVLSGTLFR